jgi:uncharacterized protein
MATELKLQGDKSRYVLVEDGEEIGITGYVLRGNAIHLTHTEIDPERRDQGLADTMVRAVMDDIRSTTEHRVVAACPYVEEWLDRNPDYQDLEERS